MEENINNRRRDSSVFLEHINLLWRMGWWDECEQFLLSYGRDLLAQEEFDEYLHKVREKQRIYETVNEPKQDGRTYIGEDDMVRMTKGPVTLVYHLKDRHLDVEHIYRSILWIAETVRQRLSYAPSDIRINLHGRESEIQYLGGSDATASQVPAGSYDGTIHLRSSAFYSSEPQQLTVMIAHEYVHQAVFDLTAGRCPRWLDEGLALLLSQDLSDTYREALANALESDLCFPMDALESGELFEAGSGPATLAYAQSYSMTQYLCDQIGWKGISRLLHMIRKSPVEKALQEFSLNYYLLERQWKRWARGKA